MDCRLYRFIRFPVPRRVRFISFHRRPLLSSMRLYSRYYIYTADIIRRRFSSSIKPIPYKQSTYSAALEINNSVTLGAETLASLSNVISGII